MRMRKKKHADDRLLACKDYLYTHEGEPMSDPAQMMGRAGAPVYLEIGAGKGGFAVGMVKKNPDVAYYAMERVTDCVVLAVERAQAEKITGGLRFIIDTADNLTRTFEARSIDRIFLNFSDPWSKKGYAKRRLTHRRYLSVYFNLLKAGGKLCFKTDNVGLFDFTLEELSAIGLSPEIVTRDLHASPYMKGNVVTEYEASFSRAGVPINMLEVTLPEDFSIEISADLAKDRKEYREKEGL